MTVLLDTNVVSELIRKAPDFAVEAWAAGHPARGTVDFDQRLAALRLRTRSAPRR